jgi:hypothetical protein
MLHWPGHLVLLLLSDHGIRHYDATVEHSLSCTSCREGAGVFHPLRDLDTLDVCNDLMEVMVDRTINKIKLQKLIPVWKLLVRPGVIES